MPMIKVGSDAPEFSLCNQDGKTVKKSDYADAFVLLWWYPKADTPGWTIEGNEFRDRIQDFKNRDTSVVGVSYDDQAANAKFRDKYSFPFDLLSDAEGVVSVAFGVSEPNSDSSPRKSVLIGPDGKVVAVYEQVNPAEHPAQILRDLDVLTKNY